MERSTAALRTARPDRVGAPSRAHAPTAVVLLARARFACFLWQPILAELFFTATACGRRLGPPPQLLPAKREQRRQELAGIALGGGGDVLGRALGDDAPAAVAALGAEIEDP